MEDVKAEMSANKLTVIGKADPIKLRDKLSQKTKKKVELVSPQPSAKKENKAADDKPEKKPDDKKPKEVSTIHSYTGPPANVRPSFLIFLIFFNNSLIFVYSSEFLMLAPLFRCCFHLRC